MRSPAARVPVPGAALSAEEDVSQAALLHARHLVPAHWTCLVPHLAACEADHVLLGNQAAVDEDRALALVLALDHGVHHLLAHQVELVVPRRVEHSLQGAAVYGGEGGRLHLQYTTTSSGKLSQLATSKTKMAAVQTKHYAQTGQGLVWPANKTGFDLAS